VAQLTGCLHSVGTARLAQCTWPTIGPVAAHVHDRLTAHNGGSGPRLSGLALHRRGRVAGYALGAAMLDSDGEAAAVAVLISVASNKVWRCCSAPIVHNGLHTRRGGVRRDSTAQRTWRLGGRE
jgi:hypothetical protein